MKKIIFSTMIFLMSFSLTAEAQLLKKISKQAEKAAEKAVLKKTDQKVTTGTDKAMDQLLKTDNPEEATDDIPKTDEESASVKAENKESDMAWSKYNFVPGDLIIFEDNLAREENGEFPSRWDLIKGNAENALLEESKIILLNNSSIITPLIEKEDYLPEVFTVEFDLFFNDTYSHWQEYVIRFYPGDQNQRTVDEKLIVFPLRVNKNGASIQVRASNELKEFKTQGPEEPDGISGWKHIAISYNQRSFKVFIDQDRVLNVPNITLDPQSVSIEARDSQKDHIMAVKNIRIAEGGKGLYDRIIADGKFVTRGILFDPNRSTLKPESMGVINEIATLMKAYPDMAFLIEGHTDSDGEEADNQKLSEQRALAVKEALVKVGIQEERLQHKGLGENVPVADNHSPEGKSNNRRVVFIKL